MLYNYLFFLMVCSDEQKFNLSSTSFKCFLIFKKYLLTSKTWSYFPVFKIFFVLSSIFRCMIHLDLVFACDIAGVKIWILYCFIKSYWKDQYIPTELQGWLWKYTCLCVSLYFFISNLKYLCLILFFLLTTISKFILLMF